MRISKKTQKEVEDLLKACGYKVRYEKGNFKGGFCLIENQKIIVINKFFPYESQMNSLLELAATFEYSPDDLDDAQKALVSQIKRRAVQPSLFEGAA